MNMCLPGQLRTIPRDEMSRNEATDQHECWTTHRIQVNRVRHLSSLPSSYSVWDQKESRRPVVCMNRKNGKQISSESFTNLGNPLSKRIVYATTLMTMQKMNMPIMVRPFAKASKINNTHKNTTPPRRRNRRSQSAKYPTK